MQIGPRFRGSIVLPKPTPKLGVNYRSMFAAPVYLSAKKVARVFGMLAVTICDKSTFRLDATNLKGALWTLTIYWSPRFPFVGLSNLLGRARKCTILFALNIGQDQQAHFRLLQTTKGETKFFSLGDLYGCPRPAVSPGYSTPQDLEELQARLLAEQMPLSIRSFAAYQAEMDRLRIPPCPQAKQARNRFRVLLNCAIRRNHARARRLLVEEMAMFRWSGHGDLAEAFEAKVQAVTAPYLLSQHGYRRSLCDIPLQVVLQELRSAMDTLARLDAPSCIACGTLLGLVRDGTLLPHDDDIDLSVHIKGASLVEVVANWKRLMETVLATMAAFRKKGFLALILPCGIEVDLFPMWILQGRLYAYPHLFGEIAEDQVFPLITREWAGVQLHTPVASERILAASYGDGWRASDPYWKFDWRLSHERFADFRNMAMR